MRTKSVSTGIVVFLLVLLGLPSVAMANAGTPLMWVPGIRLIFLNIVIGIAEGLIEPILQRALRNSWPGS